MPVSSWFSFLVDGFNQFHHARKQGGLGKTSVQMFTILALSLGHDLLQFKNCFDRRRRISVRRPAARQEKR